MAEGSKSLTQKQIVDPQADPGTCYCDMKRRRRKKERRRKMKWLPCGKVPLSKGVKK